MREIMIKELRLSASALSYLFIAFGLMFFVPGYPILCGVFFVTLGIFQSFPERTGGQRHSLFRAAAFRKARCREKQVSLRLLY